MKLSYINITGIDSLIKILRKKNQQPEAQITHISFRIES